MALELWIPPAAPPAFKCHCCGAEFTDKHTGQRHVAQCVKRHADEIAAVAQARDESALGGPLDKEMWQWGRRRVAEGKVGFRRGRAA